MEKTRIRLLVLLLLMFSFGFSQVSTKIIELPKFYKGKGVVFPKEYKSIVSLKDYESSFTPTVEQIKKAEALFIDNYNEATIESINKINDREPENYPYPKPVKDVKKKFCRYYRQYLGYRNAEGDEMILVNLLNFSKKSKAKKAFMDWEKEYIVAFDGFYQENMTSYLINLSKEKLIL